MVPAMEHFSSDKLYAKVSHAIPAITTTPIKYDGFFTSS